MASLRIRARRVSDSGLDVQTHGVIIVWWRRNRGPVNVGWQRINTQIITGLTPAGILPTIEQHELD